MKIIKNSFLITLLLSVLLLCNSCNLRCLKGNGEITSETRNVSGFTELEVSSALKVIYTPSSTYKVEVVADDNLIGYITTEVHGNELQIEIKNMKCFNKITKGEIHVSAPYLTIIEVSGASEFETSDTIKTENLHVKLSGASKIYLKAKTTTLTGELSGASFIDVSGKSTNLSIDASGASEIIASSLLTKTAAIEFSGASSGTINVKNILNADLSGASNLGYYGNPTVSQNTSGSSTIIKK